MQEAESYAATCAEWSRSALPRPALARNEDPPLAHAARAIESEITAGDTDACACEAAGVVASEDAAKMRAQMLAASARGTHIDEVAEAADQGKGNKDAQQSAKKRNNNKTMVQKNGAQQTSKNGQQGGKVTGHNGKPGSAHKNMKAVEDVWDARGAHGAVWDCKEPMEQRPRWR